MADRTGASRRDDFTERVKRALSDRVGGLCSNPACMRPTKGPHTDDEKVLNIGKASHIHAASEGGPRYDRLQTRDERRSASNGIWLCSDHAAEVDADEIRFPADQLKQWKAEAERDAELRFDAQAQGTILGSLRQTTEELLAWPQTLPDGTWLERGEMSEVRAALARESTKPVVLLGAPGSGKSAFLSRLGTELRSEGWNVVAIKADRLPKSVSTLRELAEYIGIDLPIGRVLYALGRKSPTILILDQLDALSDLVDLHTERLSVLLSLIAQVADFENVRVVCSVRDFDFRHDVRFAQFDATEVHLSPVAIAEVDRAVAAAGVEPARIAPKLKSLLQIPHWLKLFLKVTFGSDGSLPASSQALLEAVWQQNVLQPAPYAKENDAAISSLAMLISQREELWVPRPLVTTIEGEIQRLLSSGVLATDEAGLRVGFSHQSLYEFARARAFVHSESLVGYAIERQGALFVRPAIWTALTYLRVVDPTRYRADLDALWKSSLRPHLRLLLVEFVAQLPNPDDSEAALLLPLFQEPRWAAACFNASAQSEGWRIRLHRGALQAAMVGSNPGAVYAALVAGLKHDRDQTVELMARVWGGQPKYSNLVLSVLVQLTDWSVEARDLADAALAHQADGRHVLESLAWQLKTQSPTYGIYLVVEHLKREFSALQPTLQRSPPLTAESSIEDKFRWHVEREPRRTLEKVIDSASQISVLIELAGAAPELFLRSFLPWLAAVLDEAADVDEWHPSYRDDHFVDCSRTFGPVRELPHALRAAAEFLADSDASRFLALMAEWVATDLLSIHVILSYGLERLGGAHGERVAEYLVGDPRRLHLRESSDPEGRTGALLRSVENSLTSEWSLQLEAKILQSQPSSESAKRPVQARAAAFRINRKHRARLLGALPRQHLSQSAAALLDQEQRVFGERPAPVHGVFELQEIGSPMSAVQMGLAADDHIVRLFEELTDSTDFAHPLRSMEGGCVQASREFASFAKVNVSRALAIIARLVPKAHETPVGMAIEALAESDLSTAELFKVIFVCDERGFASEDFRAHAASALEKRATVDSGLPQSAIELLDGWLGQKSTADRVAPIRAPDKDAGSPPFLFGHGGGYTIPHGNYPILDALLVALLSSKPPRTEDLLKILGEHVERDEAPQIWKAFAHRLQWLRVCDKAAAGKFLDRLFARYPEVLEWGEGVVLVAFASWWVEASTQEKWIRAISECSWKHGKHAAGELVALLATRQPPVAWAQRELATIVSSANDARALGAAHALGQLWKDPCIRGATAPLLRALITCGDPAVDAAILKGLDHDEMVGDDHSVALVEALAARDGPFPLEHAHAAVSWVNKLVHACPGAVYQFLDRLVALMTSEREAPVRLGGASAELVDVAITLQRIPGFREEGLLLFEQLLDLNLYGARRVLEEIDFARRDGPQ